MRTKYMPLIAGCILAGFMVFFSSMEARQTTQWCDYFGEEPSCADACIPGSAVCCIMPVLPC